MAIRLEDVGLTLGGKSVLSAVTLALSERRIAVLGRNGSGKTTLLRVVAGLVAPTTGRVSLGGIDPFTDRKGALQRVGILFQNPDHQILFPTVAEELAFGLIQQGQGRAGAEARVQAWLAAAGRADWAGLPVSTLSQGQKQWLCLQAVLLMQPETILLDEPLSALDLPTQARMGRMLAALPQRTITVTHAPETARHADQVIWLEAGRVRASGVPDQVIPAYIAHMAELGAMDADPDIAD